MVEVIYFEEQFESDLEFLYEIQSIFIEYDDNIKIDDPEELPENDSIYWLYDLELDR